MKLIDLHCDTAERMYHFKTALASNNLHISLKYCAKYDNYAQVMAFFAPRQLNNDEGFYHFLENYGYFISELSENPDKIVLISEENCIDSVWKSGKCAALISIEDARILNGCIERLDYLYKKGVRFAVLMWDGETCIGGSFNTGIGLTDFGCKVTRRCFELGIIPDISHASEQTADDIIAIANEYGKPIIASHSNSYTVYPHDRNCRDRHFKEIRDMGGIVGISLCGAHISSSNPTIDDIIRHIDHYLSLDGENTIALGCDLDGAKLPSEFLNITDIEKIAIRMSEFGYSDEIIDKIFWKNAKNFIDKNVR
jgi:membrane dipeptidase